MKKVIKFLSLALALILIIGTFAGCSAKNYVGTKKTKEKLEYTVENNEITIVGYTDTTTQTQIVIPDEIDGIPVTAVADFGLFNAESLKKITIGKNIKTIGTWAMTNNQHLQEFEVAEGNEYFTAVDGILFTKDMKTIVYYPCAKGVEFSKYGDPLCRDPEKDDFVAISYTIPDTVETIRSKAFYKCYYIDEIVIPDSVKTIEEKAFHHCESLNALNLPKQLEFIGKDAFAYCKKIENVTIPSTIKQIDEYAFFFCDNMKELNIEAKESDITLGNKWYPTNNGRQIKECKINWK